MKQKNLYGLKKLNNSQLVIEALLLLIGVAAIYTMAALVTFDPADPSWSQTAWHEPIKNIGGYAGAILADILLFTFGVVAYMLPFLLLLLCWQGGRYFYKIPCQPINYFSLSIVLIGIIAFVFSSCALSAMNVDDWYYYASGGVIGSLLISAMLPVFSFTGSTLVLLSVWAMGITLITGYSWLFIAEKTGALILQLLALLPQPAKQLNNESSVTAPNTEDEPELNLSVQALPSVPILTESQQIMLNHTDENQLTLRFEPHTLEEPTRYAIDTNFPPLYINGELSYPDAEQAELITSVQQPAGTKLLLAPLHEQAAQLLSNSDGDIQPVLPVLSISSEIDLTTDKLTDGAVELKNQLYPEQNRQQPHTATLLINDAVVFATQDADAEPAETTELSVIDVNQPMGERAQQDDNTIAVNRPAVDSLIHPLLMRNETPLTKPTTPLPTLNLLSKPTKNETPVDVALLKATAARIERTLADYRVKATVVGYFQGPVITLYELELAPGVKAARISALARDLARALAVTAVRVVEVIPGKPYVGLELPNNHRQTVFIREVLDCAAFREAKSPLTIVLGKDIAGQPVIAELGKMPHLLVAGTTGSGKSVGVNAMIISILYKAKPEEVRFIMIDPKMLELSVYEGIPHLLTEVVTDMKDAANALRWCVGEMERRYKLMSALGVRNLAGYNDCIYQAEQMGRPIPDPFWKPGDSIDASHPVLDRLPYIVVMVDEFADLIMAVGKKVEELIARLAQKARAAGIHLVLATQRPSVDVITGLIKANIPTRIAFTVSSKIDSRTILDQGGAESLLGMGDMLYLPPNSSLPVRVHGAFVRDEEVHAVVQDWKARGRPQYIESITATVEEGESSNEFDDVEELDPLFDQAVAFVVDKRKASISGVQRQFRIGYNRAARIIEQMETQGIVSAPSHNGNREVLAPGSFSGNDF